MENESLPPMGEQGAGATDVRHAACLREEISFWQGMLAAANARVPAESVERMSFALALAEFRLRQLEGDWPGGAMS